MKKIIAFIISIITILATVSAPVMADEESAETSSKAEDYMILTNCGSKEGSESISCVLELALNIFSVGVGILGVIGITVVGIQYMTAGGDEGKARKSKQRMLEIAIGLAAYAIMYAILSWLNITLKK